MKRNLTFEEISDGKKYSSDDLVKVSCNDCAGCSECCKVTDDTILLDPYDIFELSKGLNKTFEEMMGTVINLTVIDGVITPYLCKRSDSHACSFLDANERCSIHSFRPGFCRLFPLGRIYDEEGNFSYFIQVHECPYENKAKVKVKKWLGIPRLSLYEDFIRTWHSVTSNLSDCALENASLAKAANMKLLNTFFVAPYSSSEDFFKQFYDRYDKYLSGM